MEEAREGPSCGFYHLFVASKEYDHRVTIAQSRAWATYAHAGPYNSKSETKELRPNAHHLSRSVRDRSGEYNNGGSPRVHYIFIHSGAWPRRRRSANPLRPAERGGGVPLRSEQKLNGEPRQQCWGTADREGSGEGWLDDPLLGGSDYNQNITHTRERPEPHDRPICG